MSEFDDASYSYDRVPYRSWPYVQSHPDRLASIALLLGLSPCPVDSARVLELGCAAGGNLIPMAEMYPESQFLGIDLSAREVAEGQQQIAELELTNIHLRHQDILDLPAEEGPFDYIIAHGVYSWVPQPVQERILDICHRQLADQGIAYISYNTFPGWRMRSMIRDMLVYHSQPFAEPETQIEQARALLEFLAESVSTETPYGAFLKDELQLFGRVSDEYVFHDHLAGVNEPIYFHEFMQRAQGHGLQYVGEPHLMWMATSSFPEEIESTLRRISSDTIQIEQYMDFLKNRSFRQTLLCHDHLQVDRSLDPRLARRLMFASPLKSTTETDDAGNECTVFQHRSTRVATDRPLIRAALTVLSDAWPAWVDFETLWSAAWDRSDEELRQASDVETQKNELVEHLVRCHAANVVELHASAPRFVTRISEYPTASPVSRRQAADGQHATNRKHEIVTLDEVTREVLKRLDGTRTRDALLAELCDQAQRDQWKLRENEEPVPEEKIESALQTVLDATLEQLRDAALLIG